MAEVKKNAEELKQELGEKSFALDLLTEFKKTNQRMFYTIIGLIIALIITNGIWLFTFTSYDFVSTTEATGVHVLIDSEGNIIAEDVTPEMLEAVDRWIIENGKNKSNQNKNEEK